MQHLQLKEAYLEVSRRAIAAAEATLVVHLQEATGFFAYHAFESMGGALCTAVNEDYSFGHGQKINQFVAIANNRRYFRRNHIGRNVAQIAMQIASLRNRWLYPEELLDGEIHLPSEIISESDARDLLKRVKGVCKPVEKVVLQK